MTNAWVGRTVVVAILVAGALASGLAWAEPLTADQQCLLGRQKAWSKYLKCQNKALAVHYTLGIGTVPADDMLACVAKLDKAWPKLAALQTVQCQGDRFVDSVAGIVDRLTGLEWERKTDDASIHDKDNTYAYGVVPSTANGDAFTTFIDTLNNDPACLEGSCDWRLPNVVELQTIRLADCSNSPCVLPLFVPTATSYMTGSLDQAGSFFVWLVSFNSGAITDISDSDQAFASRAVHGGLL